MSKMPFKDALFDVWNEDDPDADPEFVMRAPLSTIAAVYRLQEPAWTRIAQEVPDKGRCDLYSSRGNWKHIRVEWGCERWQMLGEAGSVTGD